MALITSGALPPERMRIMAGKSTKDEPTPEPVVVEPATTSTKTTNVEGDVNIDIDWDNWPDRGVIVTDDE
jgi:hypothetical protein